MDHQIIGDKKIRAAQALFDEIDALAREENKLSFVASTLFEKYFAEEISCENADLFLAGDRRDIRLHFEILLDYLFNLRQIIHTLSAASCGNHRRPAERI